MEIDSLMDLKRLSGFCFSLTVTIVENQPDERRYVRIDEETITVLNLV